MVYLGKDLLGSVKTATGTYGSVEERYEYDVFGVPYRGELDGGMDLGYTGKGYDVTTGLYNYGYRDYQPGVARFTTVDPVRDGVNWYAYVNNDPVNWVDPWGLTASDGNTQRYIGSDRISAGGIIGPGEWNPPGNQPISFYVGNEIHRAIGIQYTTTHSNDTVYTNYQPISTIAGVPYEGSAMLRPDIYNLSTGDLYEIKSTNDAGSAAPDMAKKLAALQTAGMTVQPGDSLELGTYGVVPAPGGYAEYLSPAPGIILYSYHKGSTVEKPAPAYMPVVQEQRTSVPVPDLNVGKAGGTAAILYMVWQIIKMAPLLIF
jgi:RHS repeat-associated protein